MAIVSKHPKYTITTTLCSQPHKTNSKNVFQKMHKTNKLNIFIHFYHIWNSPSQTPPPNQKLSFSTKTSMIITMAARNKQNTSNWKKLLKGEKKNRKQFQRVLTGQGKRGPKKKLTVFPAPFGPTIKVRGRKNVMTLVFSGLKLRMPLITILSTVLIFASFSFASTFSFLLFLSSCT